MRLAVYAAVFAWLVPVSGWLLLRGRLLKIFRRDLTSG